MGNAVYLLDSAYAVVSLINTETNALTFFIKNNLCKFCQYSWKYMVLERHVRNADFHGLRGKFIDV